jgi:hypothetical protein
MAKTTDCWKQKFCYQGCQDAFDMTMPIDVRQVDWLYVAILALFALVANLIANLLSFRRRGVAAVLAAVLFAAAFVFWTYYPHGLPLPTTLRAQKSTATTTNNRPAETPPSSAPQKPSNPVTDITPPSSNSR